MKDIHSILVEQSAETSSLLVICAEPFTEMEDLPPEVVSMINDTLGFLGPQQDRFDLLSATDEEPF